MRNWLPISAAAALALLLALGLWPFHAREVRDLLPVQALCAEWTDEGLTVTTDNGLSGTGGDWPAALAALEASAPGEVFYGTAGAAFLPDETLLPALLDDERLRPAIRLYLGAPPVPLEAAAGWSAQQQDVATLAAIRAGHRTRIAEAGA